MIKDGEFIVFAINKTPREVQLSLSLNVRHSKHKQTHRALLLEQAKTFNFTDDVLQEIPSKNGAIVLPPLFISRIDLAGTTE